VQHPCLTHPALGFWVDVRLREFDGRWLAVADLAVEPDVGVSKDPQQAVGDALAVLGPRLANELALSASLDQSIDTE
jgi:hypothetical protein